MRASASSLLASSSVKAIAKVLIGPLASSAISAATRLESRPPLSITPSGTSLTILARTEVRRRSSSCSWSSSQLWPVPVGPSSHGVQ